MWGQCNCGHHKRSHGWDARKYRHMACRKCRICDRADRDHGPFTHPFQRCDCLEYREAA